MTHALATASTLALGPKWFDANYLLSTLGGYLLPVIAVIIFAECGLLIGFFLPGDSLLFPLGLFIAQGYVHTPLWLACLILSVCAVLGNIVGYGVGYAVGPRLFSKPDSKLFKRAYVDKTHEFFEKHGARAVILARFVPIVRCFITAVAGVGRMEPKRYLGLSVIGGIVWASGVTVAGYFLGQISFIGKNIDAIMVVIVVVSVLPLIFEWARHRKNGKLAAASDTEVTTQLPKLR